MYDTYFIVTVLMLATYTEHYFVSNLYDKFHTVCSTFYNLKFFLIQV